MTTEEMIAAGMTTNDRGWWITGKSTRDYDSKQEEEEAEVGEEAAD